MKEPGKEQIDKMIIFADNLLCVDSQRKKKKKATKVFAMESFKQNAIKKKNIILGNFYLCGVLFKTAVFMPILLFLQRLYLLQ